MKRDEIYGQWKERKAQIEIDKAFSQQVMERIYQYEQSRNRSWFDSSRFIDIISAHPLAKAGLIVSGALAGLVRLLFIIMAILNGGTISG